MNIEKNFLKIFSAIKKKNIPLELHEPYIDKNDILSVSEAVRNKSVAGKGDYTKKFEKKVAEPGSIIIITIIITIFIIIIISAGA